MTERHAIVSKIKIEKVDLNNLKINIPSSKSYLNRALILAAILKSKTILTNVHNLCDDVKDMLEVLKKLGVKIELKQYKNGENKIIIFGTNGKFTQPKDKTINCGLGGTTTRFLLGLSALFDFDITITAQGKMLDRPIKEMFKFLKSIGKEIVFLKNENCLPVLIKCKNQHNVKKIKLDGSKSSQFLSSILMIANRLNIEIIEVENLVSKSYINITLDVLKKINVNFIRQMLDKKIIYQLVKNKKNIDVKNHKIKIEKDFSSASYFLALQYIFDIQKDMMDMQKKSSQGDAKFVKIIEKIEKYKQKNDRIKPLILNMKNMPDVSMTAMVVCALQNFITKIIGLKTLKIKECDRLTAMQNELKKVGVKTKISSSSDAITIYGKDNFTLNNQVEIDTYNDHRIAMCFAILGAKIGNLKINNSEVVNKSFPNFWNELEKFNCVKIV